MSEIIGFIGLGNMGFPMARRLVEAGYKLVVCDVRQDVVDKLVKLGARAAKTPREVADATETVFVSLPTPAVVEAVALGADGVIHGNRVTRFVDLSTTGPSTANRIGAALAARKVTQIDAPVSGGVPGAEKGTLAVMVSGPKAEVAKIEAPVKVIGKMFYVGEKPGLGQTMKLVNNMLSAAALAISSEGFVMGVKAGLDPNVMVEVVNASTGANTAVRDKFPRSVIPGTFDYGFAMGLLYKDVRLCMEEAEALGCQMFVGGAVRSFLQLANNQLGPNSDFTAMVKLPEQWGGVEVRAPKKKS